MVIDFIPRPLSVHSRGLLYAGPFLYSFPRVFLKGRNVLGYAIVESFWLLLPLRLAGWRTGDHWHSFPAYIWGTFAFCQNVYILCQKDLTDEHDRTNLFLAWGSNSASHIVILFAALASFALFFVADAPTLALLIWGVNSAVKVANCYLIFTGKITRRIRSRLVLFEFLTPFIFLLTGMAL